jgi:hypothetical protein
MPNAKALVSLPMHSVGLDRERVRNTEIVAAQALSHLYPFKDHGTGD